MLGRAVAFAATAAACLAAPVGRAQDQAADDDPTAEEMIEVAREVWGSPGMRRRCPAPRADEIVVCATNPDELRVESPTDEAIRKGERPPGRQPNAAHLFDPPPCVPSLLTLCSKVGRTPPRPAAVDLTGLPEPLTPEEAALVFRAEDLPAEPATPAAASPEAAR
jgi:hypothetical protein